MTGQLELIIPAFNEGHRIGKTLEDYLIFFNETVHLTVVMNGCTDSTAAVVERWRARFPERLNVITTTERIGKGAAIVLGWKQANSKYIGFVDADDSTTAAEFNKLMTAVEEADGAIASRFLPQAAVYQRQSPLRTLMSKTFIGIVHVLYRLPFQDTQCGAKLFERQLVAPLLAGFQETGFIFDIELLWKLQQHGARIVEVPIHWVDQPGSAALGTHQQFLSAALRMFWDIVRLRFKP